VRIYLASSWRNKHQAEVLQKLRNAGHEVYDFKHPRPEDDGFSWTEVDPDWLEWDGDRFRTALKHPIAERGFANDWNAMLWANACVLLLPCGRSAHIEAGYFVGARKLLIILMMGSNEPELMYKMASHVCLSIEEVINQLASEAA
jgi:hypothetical protein